LCPVRPEEISEGAALDAENEKSESAEREPEEIAGDAVDEQEEEEARVSKLLRDPRAPTAAESVCRSALGVKSVLRAAGTTRRTSP
jgi:hypothetical protein